MVKTAKIKTLSTYSKQKLRNRFHSLQGTQTKLEHKAKKAKGSDKRQLKRTQKKVRTEIRKTKNVLNRRFYK